MSLMHSPAPVFVDPINEFLLKDVHPHLAAVARLAYPLGQFRITTGHRGESAQTIAKAHGKSNASFGQSAHNFLPACAVDVIPHPFNGVWDAEELPKRLETIARHFKMRGEQLGYPITWGGDWVHIKDFCHLELSNWRQICAGLPPAA